MYCKWGTVPADSCLQMNSFCLDVEFPRGEVSEFVFKILEEAA